MLKTVIRYLQAYNIDVEYSELIATIAAAALAIALIIILALIVKRILLRIIGRFAARTATRLDDLFVSHNVFSGTSQILPPILIHLFAVPVLQYYPAAIPVVRDISVLYLTIVIIKVSFSVFDALLDFYASHPASSKLPLKSFAQVLKTIIVSIGLIFIVSKLMGKSPVVFFSSLGAFTAVLLLIFKDSILGLVAGVQLSANNLVRVGDIIEMPKYGANGEVTDISLVTVSVQNSDKSIVTIPAYALISEGFKNWRGMDEADGRRIKRSINIDMTSVRFCDDEMLRRLQNIVLLREYLPGKLEEIRQYNLHNGIDSHSPVNGRRLTNLGSFRAYLTAYYPQNAGDQLRVTLLVRYLQPDENGLPIEIYGFSHDKTWASYEALQADITDHIIAVLPYFGLRVFQLQAGSGPEPADFFPSAAMPKTAPEKALE